MIKDFFKSRNITQENCMRYLQEHGGKVIKTINSIYLVEEYRYCEDLPKHEQVHVKGDAVIITENAIIEEVFLNSDHIVAIEVYKPLKKESKIITEGRN